MVNRRDLPTTAISGARVSILYSVSRVLARYITCLVKWICLENNQYINKIKKMYLFRM